MLEAQMRADMLNKDMSPKEMKPKMYLQRAYTIPSCLGILMKQYLPSEQTSGVEASQAPERTLKAGKTFRECLSSVR
eukprot:4040452-Amphidinium_carterae.1